MELIGTQIDRYEILELIGQGGMASVYRAVDTRLRREVALKLIRTGSIPPDMLSQLQKRFEIEATSQAGFDHPHIVPIHDFGEHNGAPYLVMALRPAGTLKDRTGKPMPWQEAAAILAPIADALAHAHSMDLVHRDVKPSNILLDARGVPALTDFGIAKILGEVDEATLTRTGLGIGTPGYMAPEQWEGKPEKTSDIYALGVVFYELVTGRRPYQADTSAKLAILQATEPVPAPRKLIKGLPEHVERVLLTALAFDAGGRYDSMADFAASLHILSRGADLPVVKAPKLRRRAGLTPAPTMLDDEGGEAEVVEVQKRKAPQPEPAPESQAPEPTGPPRRSLPKWAWGVILGAALIGISLLLSLGGDGGMPFAAATATATTTATPTATLGVGSSYVNPIDDASAMYIPAGSFLMGSEDGYASEQPVHEVYLDAFWMYQTEVTNEQYRQCVEDGSCNPPSDVVSFNDPDFANHPVVFVDWYKARAYCEWAGGRLPTEAEWEKAARGGLEGKDYPWGDDAPTCSKGMDNGAQYGECSGQTITVASFGANGYGLHDMAGNVWEWVADWFDSGYYDSSPYENPQGPGNGSGRVLRSNYSLRVANRYVTPSLVSNSYVGFRCASLGPGD